MNNFKELQKLQEEQYRLNLENLQNKMDNNIGFLGAFTQIIEMYLSKVVDCILNIAGAGKDDQEKPN